MLKLFRIFLEGKNKRTAEQRNVEYRTEEVATAVSSQNSGSYFFGSIFDILLFCGSSI
jgi:hypothetical protein